ncbi:MAG: glycoside hydrolase family 3 N-terminal domain-containing protein, partial [Actinomycetota bacterium]
MTETSKDAALPYRDASLPVAERVADLLGRMSLEEKVDQMTSVMPSFCMRDGRVALDLVAAAAGNGIGQVSRPVGSARIAPREGAELVNAIQHHFVEETRLGIPAIMHEECLSGVQAHGTTIFPQSIGNACTWDPDLIEQMTTAIRRQMRALGIHQGLSPVLDVARDARWGRIEETFGEDPYLVARIATAFVRGLQGDDPATGVMATLKHFIGYSFSEGGRNIGPVRIGERELRDVFGFPFETAIQEAHAWSVMNAYHENDGVPVIASPEILTGLLRDEYGFDGTLVSDYFSINFTQVLHGVAASLKEAAVLSVKAGLDTELPLKSAYAQPLIEAVAEGLVEEAEIDRLVERVLAWKFRLGLFENAYVDPGAAVDLDTPADRALARRLAQRSIVLLKNESGLLPLNPNLGCVAVIGPNADREWALLGDYSFDVQSYSLELVAKGVNEPGGPAAEGGIEPETAVPVVTVLEGIRSHVGPATEVRFAAGCGVVGERDEALFAEAVAAARGADVAVVVVGDQAGIFAMGTVGENRDSCSLRLPGVQEELIRA